MILKDKIISFYHPLLEDLGQIEIPEEKIASCSNCNLCRSNQSAYVNTKCCSYFPKLPNFLIGGLLLDQDQSLSHGQEQIKSLLLKQNGVSPYGLFPSLAYTISNKDLKNSEFWSRPKEILESQLCPYYLKGACTIWKYRENLCMTYFCSSVGGKAGKLFWKKVNQYLEMVETSLARYSMLQLGWPPAQIKTNEITTLDFNFEDEQGNINQKNYTKLWGDWAGREEEFYIKCYEIVSKIDAEKFKQITGLERDILEAAIRDTQKEFLNKVIPEKLMLSPEVVLENAEEGFTQLIFGEVEAKIPTLIVPLIKGFNGERTTIEIYQLGFNVLYNMEATVDELREKGMLVKV